MGRSRTAMVQSFSVVLLACAAWSTALSSAAGQATKRKGMPVPATREAGLAAWRQVYSVLTHPRCINCHTATNYPQQGDDRHRICLTLFAVRKTRRAGPELRYLSSGGQCREHGCSGCAQLASGAVVHEVAGPQRPNPVERGSLQICHRSVAQSQSRRSRPPQAS